MLHEITDYRSSLGKLMYLANDHPDIDFAANCLARKSSCPTDLDIQRLRRVVRYIRGHPTVKWTFIADGDDFAPELIVYTDSDWAGDAATRRSTSGGVLTWGTSTLGAWSKLQAVVALSSAEAEYYAMVVRVQRSLGVQAMLKEASVETRLIL